MHVISPGATSFLATCDALSPPVHSPPTRSQTPNRATDESSKRRDKHAGAIVASHISYECHEQRNDSTKGWTHEVDVFALGAIVRDLIFLTTRDGGTVAVREVPAGPAYVCGRKLPRDYTQREVWRGFFADTMAASVHPKTTLQYLSCLRLHRRRFQSVLEQRQAEVTQMLDELARKIRTGVGLGESLS